MNLNLVYGTMKTDGTYNGMVGQLERKEVDLSAAGLSRSAERASACTYLHTLLRDNVGLIGEPLRNPSLDYWAYIHIFTDGTWMITVFQIIFLIVYSYFHYNCCNNKFSILESAALVLNPMGQMDFGFDLKQNSQIILMVTTRWFGFLIFAFYTGLLTSFMTFSPIHMIHSLQDAVNSHHKIMVQKGSMAEDYLLNANPDSDKYKFYMKHIKPYPFLTNKEDINVIYRSLQKDPTYLNFGTQIGTNFTSYQVQEGYADEMSIVVQKDSELAELFNFKLLKLEQSGILPRLLSAHFNKQTSQVSDEQTGKISLGFNNLLFLFILLTCGVLVSLLFAVLEWTCNMCANNKN